MIFNKLTKHINKNYNKIIHKLLKYMNMLYNGDYKIY